MSKSKLRRQIELLEKKRLETHRQYVKGYLDYFTFTRKVTDIEKKIIRIETKLHNEDFKKLQLTLVEVQNA